MHIVLTSMFYIIVMDSLPFVQSDTKRRNVIIFFVHKFNTQIECIVLNCKLFTFISICIALHSQGFQFFSTAAIFADGLRDYKIIP